MKLKDWIIKKYYNETLAEAKDLIWLRKKIKAGSKIDWSFVDTVDYDIDSIPRKKEMIMEFKLKPREVLKCQNLLSLKKERCSRTGKRMIT